MKRVVIAIGIVAVILIALGIYIEFFTQDSDDLQKVIQEPKQNLAIMHEEITNKVGIKNFIFMPQELTVGIGQKVTWINYDSLPHTITSSHSSEMSSLALTKGQKYEHTFNNPGTYSYYCALHPQMKGKIIVK